MKIRNIARSVAAASVVIAVPAMAEQFGPLEITGFAKDEYSLCDNCSEGLVNPSPYDPRGVLSPPDPMVNQPGDTSFLGKNLGLVMLRMALSHEFDNAVKVEAVAAARMRNWDADIYDNWMTDIYAGVSHPVYGSLQVGKMSSRSWTRTDGFAYPLGLSNPWAEGGAGYGLYPEAVRYATPLEEIPWGKILFEATYAQADTRKPLNPSSTVPGQGPPDPWLFETFIQYSNEKNLVELIYQQSKGGRQSSFSKGAFYGAQGNTNGPDPSPYYETPWENVLVLQGNYWLNPQWKITYGVKRSAWSGQAQQCDFGPVSPDQYACYWDQAGFNYSDNVNKAYSAVEYDYVLGGAYSKELWTYSLGGVYMSNASTRNPVNWGQDNSATFLVLSAHRQMPEIYKNVEFYVNLERVMYSDRGPAPLSMPSNLAFGRVDPRVSESANTLIVGANISF
ncbi:MAG: hypothetical protein U1F09_10715 [Steroidobacteraceae bacterium]